MKMQTLVNLALLGSILYFVIAATGAAGDLFDLQDNASSETVDAIVYAYRALNSLVLACYMALFSYIIDIAHKEGDKP